MKAKLLFAVFAAFVLITLPVRAENDVRTETDQTPKGHHAMRKLGRGLANLCFGVVEVPNTITKVTSEHGGGAGASYGVGKGFARWFQREIVGVYEIITFPFPTPKGYKPIMKPEWPNEDYEP